MNDDQSQQNTDAQTTTDHDQSVLYEHPLDRETILSSLHNRSNAQPRPVTPGHGKAQDLRENADRQTMPERELEQQVESRNLSIEPDDQPRPFATYFMDKREPEKWPMIAAPSRKLTADSPSR